MLETASYPVFQTTQVGRQPEAYRVLHAMLHHGARPTIYRGSTLNPRPCYCRSAASLLLSHMSSSTNEPGLIVGLHQDPEQLTRPAIKQVRILRAASGEKKREGKKRKTEKDYEKNPGSKRADVVTSFYGRPSSCIGSVIA